MDWDLSDNARSVLSAWSAMSESNLPRLSDAALVLPLSARLTFCEQCWDDDARSGSQPYVRRSWLNWSTVHCDRHRTFLTSANRSITANASHVNWQEVWSRKAIWCEALELKWRGTGLGSLWFQASRKLSEPLMRSLVRLGDSSDVLALQALEKGIGAWHLTRSPSGRPELPVMLETGSRCFAKSGEHPRSASLLARASQYSRDFPDFCSVLMRLGRSPNRHSKSPVSTTQRKYRIRKALGAAESMRLSQGIGVTTPCLNVSIVRFTSHNVYYVKSSITLEF